MKNCVLNKNDIVLQSVLLYCTIMVHGQFEPLTINNRLRIEMTASQSSLEHKLLLFNGIRLESSLRFQLCNTKLMLYSVVFLYIELIQ